MFVIDVIPLSRIAPGTLSYRSAQDLPIGTLVFVEVRKTQVQGIVVASESVADAKAMLKGVHYMLKRSAPAASGMLPDSLLEAADHIAVRHATTVGSVLATVFAEYVQNDLPIPTDVWSATGSGFNERSCEMDIWSRAESYRALLDEVRAQGRTLLLIVPTLVELRHWKRVLRDEKPLTLSSSLSGDKRRVAIEKARTHAGLVIATPSFSWMPIAQLGAIAVERVSAGGYVLPKRPYLDMVRALRELARARSVPLLLGDFPLPLEYRANPEEPLQEAIPAVGIYDARPPEDPKERTDGPWKAIPDPIAKQIQQALTHQGRVLVLAARSGYAPAVVCRDCGQTVADEEGRSLSYGTVAGERVFRTKDGNVVLEASLSCSRCGSWNLMPLGVGQERVAEELVEQFPEAHVMHVTSDMLGRSASAKAIRDGLQKPGTIVVGTESLLPWVLESSDQENLFSLAIIASADSLLALPFWRARERFVRLAFLAASLARECVVVSRRVEDTAVQVLTGDPAFFTEETELRRALSYPPYGTLLTIRSEGNATDMDRLSKWLAAELPELSPTVTVDTPSVRVYAAMLHNDTFTESVSRKLALLPPSVRVRVDPESVWG